MGYGDRSRVRLTDQRHVVHRHPQLCGSSPPVLYWLDHMDVCTCKPQVSDALQRLLYSHSTILRCKQQMQMLFCFRKLPLLAQCCPANPVGDRLYRTVLHMCHCPQSPEQTDHCLLLTTRRRGEPKLHVNNHYHNRKPISHFSLFQISAKAQHSVTSLVVMTGLCSIPHPINFLRVGQLYHALRPAAQVVHAAFLTVKQSP